MVQIVDKVIKFYFYRKVQCSGKPSEENDKRNKDDNAYLIRHMSFNWLWIMIRNLLLIY